MATSNTGSSTVMTETRQRTNAPGDAVLYIKIPLQKLLDARLDVPRQMLRTEDNTLFGLK